MAGIPDCNLAAIYKDRLRLRRFVRRYAFWTLLLIHDPFLRIVKIARPYPHADMVLIRRPFSPNPFLPLHNFQRRFDFLGTQMHCFTEKHIRFGRSFTSQGANSLLLMDSEHRLSPARTDTPFNVPVPNGNRVEICLKLSHISAGIKRERRQSAAFLREDQFRR